MSVSSAVFYPRNLRWRDALPRLALVNELLVLVGAVSMYAGGMLGKLTLAEPTFFYQLVWMHCVGWSGMLLIATSALWWARRAWRHMPDPLARYELHGAYPGLLPADMAWLALITVLGVLVSAFLGRSLLTACLPWLAQIGPAPLPPYELAVFNTTYGGLAIYAFEFFRDRSIWSKHRAERAGQLSAQAQLDLLRSQLDPHMLFNSLSNLYELIHEDPTQARHMLLKLIAFLRGSLSSSRVDTHSLADEFRLTEAYLSIMQVRMADRLKVKLSLPEGLGDARIPAMILQPLVENAIVHGLEPLSQGGCVTVSARALAQELTLEVQDEAASGGTGLAPASSSAAESRPGGHTRFGLDHIRQRLQALYGAAASLTLTRPDHLDGTLVTMKLPLTR